MMETIDSNGLSDVRIERAAKALANYIDHEQPEENWKKYIGQARVAVMAYNATIHYTVKV